MLIPGPSTKTKAARKGRVRAAFDGLEGDEERALCRGHPPRAAVRRRAAPVELAPSAGAGERPVDDVVQPRLELAQLFLRLRLSEDAVLDRLVEVLLRAVEDRLLQPVHGLVLRLRDVGQGLAAHQLPQELRDAEPEVAGRAREVVVRAERGAVTEVAEAVRAAEEERDAAL